MDFQKGELVLINKPYRWTSFDVVNKLRNILKRIPVENPKSQIPNPKFQIKVGHAGTLDPLATGLLIICTGRFTKEIDTYQAQEKEYSGTFFLGATTPSYDLETKIDHQFDCSHITNELIFETTKKFQGKIFQTPPAYSAIKINGQRAYEKARKGKEIKLEPREVFIHEFEITQIEMPIIHFRIVCSKGTYIRSLANDFGKALNSGAYLASLCRTRIGSFNLENAMSIEEFVAKFQIEKV